MVFHWSLNDSESPGLFSVFRPILIMLLFKWSPLFLFLSLLVPLPIPGGLFRVKQLELVSPSPSCSIVFSSLARSRNLSPFSLPFNFTLWSAGTANFFSLSLSLSLCRCCCGCSCCPSLILVVWSRLCDLLVSHNPWELYASHSPGRILGCTYTTCSYGQIQISCTIPGGSSSHPLMSSLILFLCQFTAFFY